MQRGMLPAFVFLLAVVLMAMVRMGSTYAQLPQREPSVAMGGSQTGPQTRIVYSPQTEVSAANLRYDEERRTTYARGAVRIVNGSSTITADEADLRQLRATSKAVDLDITLRGNVRVLVTPLNNAIR